MVNLPGQINILEATITEFNKGFIDNAFAGYVLKEGCKDSREEDMVYKKGPVLPYSYDSKSPFKVDHKKNNYWSSNGYSPEWKKLYESWNAAFVLSELDDLHLILPKLFIPSQIDINSKQYMFNRVFALWNTINFALYRKYDGISPTPGLSNRVKMAQEWGKINKKHAKEYLKNVLKEDPDKFEKEFNRKFESKISRYWMLLKLVHKFI